MSRTFLRLCSVVAVGLLTACGGDGSTGIDEGDEVDDPGDDSPAREILENPSFGEDIQEIFARRGCTDSSCHGVAQSNNLDLRGGAAYDDLVNVEAFGDPDFIRVVPGDPENSYLVKADIEKAGAGHHHH